MSNGHWKLNLNSSPNLDGPCKGLIKKIKFQNSQKSFWKVMPIN